MKRILLTTALSLLCIVGAWAAAGDTFTYQVAEGYNLNYQVNEGDTTVTCKGLATGATAGTADLIIPETVNYNSVNYSVTSIGASAFTNCEDFTGSLTIGDSVKTIGERAFYYCENFTGSLTIPDGVDSIGDYAFQDCDGFTGSLTIGEKVTSIGKQAFYSCNNFTGSLTIPDGVTSIGEQAFRYCDGFTGSLTIGNGVKTIGDEAFKNCDGFTGSLTINVKTIGKQAFAYCEGFTGSLTIGNGVTTIGDYAFQDCYGFSGSLTIGDNVKTIGDEAFRYCDGFTGSLTIPDGVTSIGEQAFKDCDELTTFIVSKDNENYASLDGIIYNKDITAVITCPGGKTGTLTIPNSVDSIGNYAFYDCDCLTGTLTIPDGVKTIGNYAFAYCDGFTGSLTIGDSVKTIGDEAFDSCEGFTGSLTIGDNVTTIGDEAFDDCDGFTSIESLATAPPALGNYAFDDINPNTYVVVPDAAAATAYEENDAWTNYFSHYVYGDLYTITYHANGGNGTTPSQMGTQGESITLAENAFTYGRNKFLGWATTPEATTAEHTTGKEFTPTTDTTLYAVWEIKEFSALCGNNTLYFEITDADKKEVAVVSELSDDSNTEPTGTLTIPQKVSNDGIEYTVTSIGERAFAQCMLLTGSLTIPDGVRTIGDEAFFQCMFLTGSLTIPNSVDSIGDMAFAYCTGLSGALTIGNSVESIGDIAFGLCNGLTEFIIDKDNENYISLDGIIYNKDTTVVITCPGGKTGTLTIPNSVDSIGFGAFAYCNGFTSIESLATTPPALCASAFYGINPDTYVVVPDSAAAAAYKAATGWKDCFNHYVYGDSYYTITYHANGANGATPSQMVAKGESITLAENAFTYSRNNFLGWATTPEATEVEYAAGTEFTPTTDTTLYAVWEIKVFAVLCDENTLFFEITDADKKEVAAVSEFDINNPFMKNYTTALTGTLTIPQNVSDNGIEYTVTSIGESAFTFCTGLSGALTIPNTVERIGEAAFGLCSGLTGALTIPNSVESIGEAAFAYCSGFTSVVNQATAPQVISSSVFDEVSIEEIPLYVSAEAISAYEGAAVWQDFMSINDVLAAAKATRIAEIEALGDTLTESDYTAESWAEFQAAITADKDAIDYCTTVEDVNAYELTAKVEDLVEDNSGISDAQAPAPFTRLQNTLYFAEPSAVAVYNISGIMLYNSTAVTEYTLPSATGVYIIRTNVGAFKVINNE